MGVEVRGTADEAESADRAWIGKPFQALTSGAIVITL
jgi:hypothetical protein